MKKAYFHFLGTSFSASSLQSKFAGWWDASQTDQLGGVGDIVISGSDFIMPEDSTLIRSCALISSDTWFSSGTAQSVAIASVSGYCGSRQFYNSTTKELIIIKVNQHLTATEESNLMAYIGSPTIPTSYHADSTAFFARFTNSYSDKEKNRIDNFFRLFESSGAKAAGFDKVVCSALSGEEEQLLEMYDNGDVVVASNGETAQVPYRGLAAQEGCFKFADDWGPSDGVNFTQNAACIISKVSEPLLVHPPYSTTGSNNVGVSGALCQYTLNSSGNRVRFFVNSSFSAGANLTSSINGNSTFIGNRTSSSTVDIYGKNQKMATSGTATSATRNSYPVYLGDRNANGTNYVGIANHIQFVAYGGTLSDTEAKLVTDIVDNFCDGQTALANEYISVDNGDLSVKLLDLPIMDAYNNNMLYHDYANIYFSSDGGASASANIAFDQASLGWIHMAHIFDDGTIIFATNKNKIYKTTTALSSYSEIIPYKGGSTYTIHTPASSANPGEYYKFLGVKRKQYRTDGTEMLVWGNYGLSTRGACPGIVWHYETGFGLRINVAWEAGQNPYHRDDGSPSGGTSGTLLGDASETIKIRHTHNCTQRPDNLEKFILMTGDLDQSGGLGTFYESNRIELTLTPNADPDLATWSRSLLSSGSRYTINKISGGDMGNGDSYFYSGADTGGGDASQQGFFRTPIDEVDTDASFERFYLQTSPLTYIANLFMVDNDKMIGGGFYKNPPAKGLFMSPLYNWSTDMSVFPPTVNTEFLKLPGNIYVFQISKMKYKGVDGYLLQYCQDYDAYNGHISVFLKFN